MKKNRAMRAASALLVAVLMTTCTISGTFAKYVTSATATDTARVAKWGVSVSASGNEAFAEKYDNAASATGIKVVSIGATNDSVDDSVIAPGTNGALGGMSISGTPEVMVDVDVNATLNLGTGWKVTGDWNGDGTTALEETDVEYCPLVFTVGGTEYKQTTTVAALQTAVQDAIQAEFAALTAANVPANTDLSSSVAVLWSWPFNGDDAKDTALGNLAADGSAPTITFNCGVTVTQVD